MLQQPPKKKAKMTDEEKTVGKFLAKFISCNRSLLHLDLSDTGITSLMLVRLGNAINASPSLLAIHLSGNPGVLEDPVQKLAAKINATHEKAVDKQTFNQFLNDKGDRYDKTINYSNLFHQKQLAL